VVRTAGVEPARGFPLRILSPVCLPVPPHPRGLVGDSRENVIEGHARTDLEGDFEEVIKQPLFQALE
jgi:hypothetical protein